jgi:putative restriction endonuclease
LKIGIRHFLRAAHIHEFSSSRNNDPRNGLALCNCRSGRPRGNGRQNAHRGAPKRPREGGWQFDRGLWSITDDYRVIVNHDRFIEEGVPGQKLADFDGHRLFLPGNPKYWPEQTCLAWHRENRMVSNLTAAQWVGCRYS